MAPSRWAVLSDHAGAKGWAARVEAGYAQTCALTTGGGVKCWGNNESGEVGDGTTWTRLTPKDVIGLAGSAQALSVGRNHACAIVDTGRVVCWGSNYFGQLGDGTTADRSIPISVAGITGGIQAVSAGGGHTCALTEKGSVLCWGWNVSGQLGDGTTETRVTPVDVVGLDVGVQAISTGAAHTCALTESNGVKCWGWNYHGQLGDGTTSERVTPVDVSGLSFDVAQISTGSTSTCALTADGGVKCWGGNRFGQLGDGTTDNRLEPIDVIGLPVGVRSIDAGGHTCAVMQDGAVQCWGWNQYGQLGDGATQDKLVPTDVVLACRTTVHL